MRYAQPAALTGVLGSTPGSTATAADRLEAPAALSLEQLITNSDIVHICTPNALHAEQATAVVDGRKHVICEKPLATMAAAAAQLTADAHRAGVVAAVSFVYRFYALVCEMRDRILTGATGNIRLAHGPYLQDWLAHPNADNWRTDVG